MTIYLLAGFDTSGSEQNMSVVVAGPGAGTATVAEATYCFTSLASIIGTSEYTAFATAVQAALNAVTAGFTVTYSTSTHAFTISHASTFSLTWTGNAGVRLRSALGFTATLSGTNSYTSTVRPYYVIVPRVDGRSIVSDVYDGDGLTKEATADDGTSYAATREPSLYMSDWQHQLETKAATFKRAAAAAVPWTWQHFFEHSRGTHPFLAYQDAVSPNSTVHMLRAEGADWNQKVRRRMAEDDDSFWTIALMTRDLGSL